MKIENWVTSFMEKKNSGANVTNSTALAPSISDTEIQTDDKNATKATAPSLSATKNQTNALI
jgi:hypothetical protein